ncbi:MAG: tetratricopeptide repeat protein [Candidatus Aminicenantes bacterium]
MSEKSYRYPGSRPFEDTPIDRLLFFGRDKEKKELMLHILNRRLVVLFARSGLGKTSLINAGVNPLLRENGCVPLKMRFNDPDVDPVKTVFQWIKKTVEDRELDHDPGEEKTLWQFFKTAAFWTPDDRMLTPVLILDQFEEFFQFHDPQKRKEFIRQLSHLVSGAIPGEILEAAEPGKPFPYVDGPPNVKIVISIREDYLGMLDECSMEIADIFQDPYRLHALTREKAREAIINPSQLEDEMLKIAKFRYDERAVREILDFLCQQRERHGFVMADEVESFQLQLLCRHLEEKAIAAAEKGKSDVVIDPTFLGGKKGMEEVLKGFYSRCLDQLDSKSDKRHVIKLCERGLISISDRRLSIEEEEINRSFKVSSSILSRLVDLRLMRRERRVGSWYYELSHDTLVKPIRELEKRRKTSRYVTYGAFLVPFIILSIVVIIIMTREIPPDINLRNSLYEEARDLVKDSNYDRAIDKYNHILEIDKRFVKAYLELGEVFEAKGETWESIDNYKNAINNGIEDYSIYFKLGKALLERGSTGEANEYLNKAQRLNPDKSDVFEALGDFNKEKRNFSLAIKNYESALKRNPKKRDIFEKLSCTYIENDSYFKALKIFKKAISVDKEYAVIYSGMANVLKEKNDKYGLSDLLESASKIKIKNASFYFDLGYDYNYLEDFEKAIEMYLEAIRLNPDDDEAYFNLGDVFYSKGKYDEAIKMYREARRLKPENVVNYNKLGDDLYQKDKYDEAIKMYKEAIRVKPDDATAYNKLGKVFYYKDKYDEAIKEYRAAIRLNPGYDEAYFNLGYALYYKGNYDEAIKMFRVAERLNPENAVNYNSLGDKLSYKDQYDEAIKMYKEAIRVKPDIANAYKNLGHVFLIKSQYDEAIKMYKVAIRLKPDDAYDYKNLGDALIEKGLYDEAIKMYRKAELLNPDVVDYNHLGLLLNFKGKYDLSIKMYKEAIRVKPGDASAYNKLGDAFIEKGQYDEAIEMYKGAVRVKPDDATAHKNLGDALIKNGEYDEAIKMYRKAELLNPDVVDYNHLGLLFYFKGKYDLSIKMYKDAMRVKPDDATAHKNLGDALIKNGQYDEAIKLYLKALQLGAHEGLIYNVLDLASYSPHKKYFNNALDKNPNYVTIKAYEAEYYLLKNNLDEALTIAAKVIKARAASISNVLAMRAVSISALFLNGKRKKAVKKLRGFVDFYYTIKKDYNQEWSYSDMKKLIESAESLAPVEREIMQLLIDILESPWSEGIEKIKNLEEKWLY